MVPDFFTQRTVKNCGCTSFWNEKSVTLSVHNRLVNNTESFYNSCIYTLSTVPTHFIAIETNQTRNITTK